MWPLFPRPFLGRLSCWTRADMSVGAAPNGRRGRTGAITVHPPAALPSRRLLSITNCPLRWRPRALRAFPRGSANPSPNSARARNGTPEGRRDDGGGGEGFGDNPRAIWGVLKDQGGEGGGNGRGV